MTEEEAKTKWCPFARVVQPAGDWAPAPAGNREIMGGAVGALNGANLCIASACMAWRWEYAPDGSFNTRMEGPHLTVVERVPNLARTESGYCGLAGSPQ